MREIKYDKIAETVAKLCIDANYYLNGDIRCALEAGRESENSQMAKNIMDILLENADIAEADGLAICQDTGMAVVYIEMGQECFVTGGYLYDAINEGVAKGYGDGYLRKSIVKDPVRRENTGDNTPAVIHVEIVRGDGFEITVAPKGFGSENMSSLNMLTPSAGLEGVKKAIVDTVKNAGPNPCPPVVVGVGVGGTMDKAAMIAKKALLRPVDSANEDNYWAEVEAELLEEINKLNIGPGGFGGKTTCLGVNIEVFPTHIAGLPVAVNIGCHVTRHASAKI